MRRSSPHRPTQSPRHRPPHSVQPPALTPQPQAEEEERRQAEAGRHLRNLARLPALEAKLAALEGSILAAGRTAKEAARRADASSAGRTEAQAALQRELRADLRGLQDGLGRALRDQLRTDLRETNGEALVSLSRVESRLNVMEGSLSGLEVTQGEGFRRLGSTVSSAVADAEGALSDQIRQYLEPVRVLPSVLAALPQSQELLPGALANVELAEGQVAELRGLVAAELRTLGDELADELATATDRAVEQAARGPRPLEEAQWDALGRRLGAIQEAVAAVGAAGGRDAAALEGLAARLQAAADGPGPVGPEALAALEALPGELGLLQAQLREANAASRAVLGLLDGGADGPDGATLSRAQLEAELQPLKEAVQALADASGGAALAAGAVADVPPPEPAGTPIEEWVEPTAGRGSGGVLWTRTDEAEGEGGEDAPEATAPEAAAPEAAPAEATAPGDPPPPRTEAGVNGHADAAAAPAEWDAYDAYDAAVAAAPEDPAELAKAGLESLRRGRAAAADGASFGEADALFRSAADRLGRALELDPAYVAAAGNLGNTFLAHAQLKAGMADLVAEAPPEDPAELGPHQTSVGELEKEAVDFLVLAGRNFRAVLELDPNESTALVNWGRALCERARILANHDPSQAQLLYGSAIEKFDGALAAAPESFGALLGWGRALLELSDLQDEGNARMSLADAVVCFDNCATLRDDPQAAELREAAVLRLEQ